MTPLAADGATRGMEAGEVEKLAHGTGITFAGGMVNSGLAYLTGIIISRFVGAEVVGIYFLALIWTQLASTVTRLGFNDALLRFLPPARLRGDDTARLRTMKTMLTVATLVAAVVGVGAALGVGPVLRWLHAEPRLGTYLPWFFLAIPLNVLMILMLMSVQAHQDMTPVVLVRDLLQPVVLLVCSVGLLALAPPSIALTLGFAISLAVAVVAIGWRLHRLAPGLVRTPGWLAVGPLLGFAVPVMLGDVSHYLYRWIDSITISFFLEMRDVGIYNAAVRTSLLIMLIGAAVNAIFSTMASGYFHTGRHGELRAALHLSTRWCFALALPIAGVFVVGAEPILALWGAEFTRGSGVLAILALAQLLMIPGGLLAYTLVMCHRPVIELVNTLGTLLLVTLLNIVLIPRYGLPGAATALLLSNGFGLALRWAEVRAVFGFHPCDRRIAKPLAAGVVAVGVSFAVKPWLPGVASGTLPAALGGLALLGLILVIVFYGSYYVLGFEAEDAVLRQLLLRRFRGDAPTEGANRSADATSGGHTEVPHA